MRVSRYRLRGARVLGMLCVLLMAGVSPPTDRGSRRSEAGRFGSGSGRSRRRSTPTTRRCTPPTWSPTWCSRGWWRSIPPAPITRCWRPRSRRWRTARCRRQAGSVTYRLRPGLRWSDGAPVTSADVRFTWEALMNPANRVVTRTGYDLIEKVETPDATTVVLRFKRLYAPYLTLFPYVLPRHLLGSLPDLNQAQFNRLPLGHRALPDHGVGQREPHDVRAQRPLPR